MMLWNKAWREETWNSLDQDWDMIIIGGGVTGAGILREAVNKGYRCLLVDANDFSFGTSSRSSKLIHGGFRYLANRQFDVTHESVLEREWMLREARHLVTPLQFLIPIYRRKTAWQYQLGTIIYDWMAKKWQHRFLSKKRVASFCPVLRQDGLLSGVTYYDAQVDDCRLVLRLIRESVMAGGVVLNYAKVCDLLHDPDGKVKGVRIVDQSVDSDGQNQPSADIHARVVVNATGPWSDEVRGLTGGQNKIRKQRGSHLVFPLEKFPLKHGVTLRHPDDGRSLFALPWEGTLVVGTTDLDHQGEAGSPGSEPWCTREEIEYLLRAVEVIFPGIHVSRADVISSMAGLRPIISSGKENPSDESRAHTVWTEDGMISVGGGKITIFRIMARDVLAEASKIMGEKNSEQQQNRFFKPLPERLLADDLDCVDPSTMVYLSGRYGLEICDLINTAKIEECRQIDSLPNLWAELRWSARAEAVVHLDDLLLRRVRLGILLENGAENFIKEIKAIVQEELNWSDDLWQKEYERYRLIWRQAYAPEPGGMETGDLING